MTAEWRPPDGEIQLRGVVTYRCAECGELITSGMYELTPLPGGRVTSDTRSYHAGPDIDHRPEPREA